MLRFNSRYCVAPTFALLIAASTSSSAFGQQTGAAAERPLIMRGRADLNLAGAELLLAKAKEKAEQMKLQVNIAVVDDGGHLLAFARMDGARPGSANTALTKAISAATMRRPTGPVQTPGAAIDVHLNLSLENTAAVSGGKVTTLFGGVNIVIEGQTIGAVGVGGASGEQDAEIASAAIAALQAAVK